MVTHAAAGAPMGVARMWHEREHRIRRVKDDVIPVMAITI